MLKPGVIEGFYGKVWTWAERRRMVDFLSANGFGSYWYAPKADGNLRKNWSQEWSEQEAACLKELSCYCSAQNIQFGIGLSPLGLYQDWHSGGKRKLLQRLEQIASIKPDGIAILFDDMMGDLPDLARIQSEIAHAVADATGAGRIIVCPSYYSFDPILQELFGRMPDNYWPDLGKMLDPAIELFWTGDKVISSDYPQPGLQEITEKFRRKPVIWDNSIVNDGRKTSPFLNIRAMTPLSGLETAIHGMIVNPMNAASLSEIPLLSLQLNGSAESRLSQALELRIPSLKDAILESLPLFREKGRDCLSVHERQTINECFRGQPDPIAHDIIRWLEGEYCFDPACLTS